MPEMKLQTFIVFKRSLGDAREHEKAVSIERTMITDIKASHKA